MIVMKFGGTSVADADRLRAVADIVKGRIARRPVVVVSALAGVTDLLERAVALARGGDRDSLEPVIADLSRRHRWAVSAVESAARRHDLGLEIDAMFEDLRQLLRSVRVLGEGTPRAADTLLAFGETFSSRILAAVLEDRGVPCRLIDARDVLITDAAFGQAEPDAGEVAARARRHLVPAVEAGAVPVLGGFVGATRDGRTTTLGRGGSDTSAAVVGAALSVEEIEIWSDVDGIMTADPRAVPEASRRETITFAEAHELACYGAKVIHPPSIAPAVRAGIPVRVLNTLRPEGRGTLIVEDAQAAGDVLASVASRSGLAVVCASSRTLRTDPEFLPRVLAAIGDGRAVADLVVSSEVAVVLVVPKAVLAGGLAERLSEFADVESRSGRGIVCIVGRSLGRSRDLRGNVLRALAAWDPEIAVTGASATSVSAVLPDDRVVPCVRAIHREFFEGGAS